MEKPKLIRICTVAGSFDSLLKGQLKYMKKHFNVLGITSPGDRFNLIKENEEVEFVGVSMTRKITPVRDLISLFKIFKILKKESPDIVHTHTPKAGLLGMLAALLAGVPNRVHTVAGLPLLEAKGLKLVVLKYIEKLTYMCANVVYANSFGLKEHIVNLKLIKQNKIDIILNGSSNGIDTKYFFRKNISNQNKKELESELGISNQDFVFCYIGRLVGDKGINELVGAFNVISSQFKNTKLLLIGKKEEELDPLSKSTKKEMEENSNIKVIDYQRDVRTYLAISNLFVFPSYREGFPNVVMQACAMSLNCIVTNINGCNELIKDDVNGFIIKPKSVSELIDKMTFILLNPEINKKMSQISREIICSKYERLEFWEELKNHYSKLLHD